MGASTHTSELDSKEQCNFPLQLPDTAMSDNKTTIHVSLEADAPKTSGSGTRNANVIENVTPLTPVIRPIIIKKQAYKGEVFTFHRKFEGNFKEQHNLQHVENPEAERISREVDEDDAQPKTPRGQGIPVVIPSAPLPRPLLQSRVDSYDNDDPESPRCTLCLRTIFLS